MDDSRRRIGPTRVLSLATAVPLAVSFGPCASLDDVVRNIDNGCQVVELIAQFGDQNPADPNDYSISAAARAKIERAATQNGVSQDDTNEILDAFVSASESDITQTVGKTCQAGSQF